MQEIVVRVQAEYPVKPVDVWNAITLPERMKEWYFEQMPDFKAEVGFETSFLVENEGRRFPHIWNVKEVEPRSRLGYEWTFTGYEGASYALFELNEIPSGTRLTLRCTGLETFDQKIHEFREESCRAGWEYFLNKRLKEYLT
ncbi:MAG: SRPBCC domain-containing protein [Flavobacteriales bacterium]|nr:SRPBCC domain-containing protein [Flavobacteriales bacterium]NNK80130.1 SRPBCC domain-containing protein [Flavobacteriales bacterium]